MHLILGLSQQQNKMKKNAPHTTRNRIINIFEISVLLFLIFTSFSAFSQPIRNTQQSTISNNNEQLTSLETVVEDIKENNDSIKNAAHINVMVNDKLVENLRDFILDPKSIAMVEVLVLEPKAGKERISPSIIINTK